MKINFIKQIINSRLGIDKAIGYTVLGRIIQLTGSIVSLTLITLFLTKEEQGFYYTFGSILAIQVFFELGFTGIITQYVAHETAHITNFDLSKNESERKAQSRLSSLLRFCVNWFAILSFFLFIVLFITGFIFFYKFGQKGTVTWEIPWLILVINTCLSFFLSPIFSFIEGLGKVKDIAKLRVVQQIVTLITSWIVLLCGGKLYAGPLAGISSIIASLLILLFFSDFSIVLKKIWNLIGEWKVNYKREIFPYQWKIAISWISGYFIFQLFNPVLFATEGAVSAGQMGMTLTALNAISSLTMSWMTTKVPVFSKLFAQAQYYAADKLFNKTYIQVLLINLAGVISLVLIIYYLRYYEISLGERFLPVYLIALMGISTFFNQMVFSWATYLRCHKREPYLLPSIVGAVLITTSTLVLGNLYGLVGLVIGYVSIVILMKTWEYYIFKTKKREWHKII